jgi:hypothetical protein
MISSSPYIGLAMSGFIYKAAQNPVSSKKKTH